MLPQDMAMRAKTHPPPCHVTMTCHTKNMTTAVRKHAECNMDMKQRAQGGAEGHERTGQGIQGTYAIFFFIID